MTAYRMAENSNRFLAYRVNKCVHLSTQIVVIITTMEQQPTDTSKKAKKNTKTNLLKYQRPVFQIKRNTEGKVEGIIQKLMQQQKEKPEIGFLPRSHLFDTLENFLPSLQESNQKLASTQIEPHQRIDAKLQQVPDSSSSEDEEDQNEMVDQKQKMEEEKPEPTILQSCDQFQFNIMTYPYLQQKSQTKNQEQKLTAKFDKVVQITENVQLHQMEKLD